MNRDLNNKGILNRVSTSVQNGKFRVVFMYDEFIGQFNRLTQTLETYLHLITISPLFWPIKNISLQINYIEEFKSPMFCWAEDTSQTIFHDAIYSFISANVWTIFLLLRSLVIYTVSTEHTNWVKLAQLSVTTFSPHLHSSQLFFMRAITSSWLSVAWPLLEGWSRTREQL